MSNKAIGHPQQALEKAEQAYALSQHGNTSFVFIPEARQQGERLVKLCIQVLHSRKNPDAR
jgi:hypothetical protein